MNDTGNNKYSKDFKVPPEFPDILRYVQRAFSLLPCSCSKYEPIKWMFGDVYLLCFYCFVLSCWQKLDERDPEKSAHRHQQVR